MKLTSSHFSLLAAAGVALVASQAPSSAENGSFDPSTALHFEPPVTVDTMAYFLERFARRQPQFITGYEATENQRKVAEASAHAYMAAQGKAPSTKPGRTGSPATKTAKKDEPQDTHAVHAKTLPRYVAVDTARDKRADPIAKKVVMIWDTQSQTLVGNTIYDVANIPRVGSTAIFEGNSAEYVDGGGR